MTSRISRYEHFQTTGQEKLRLNDALDGYLDQDEPQEHKRSYAAYLKKRRAPAADELASRMDMTSLAQLISDGILDEAALDALALRMADPDHPAEWLKVVSLRDRYRRCALHSDRQASNVSTYSQDAQTGTAIGHTEMTDGQPDDALSFAALSCMQACRLDIFRHFPYLYAAAASLKLCEMETCTAMGTDGEKLLYQGAWVTANWAEEKKRPLVRRMFLHELLHCLFFHLWDLHVDDANEMLAADIQIEFVIERACWGDAARQREWGMLPEVGLWSELYEMMEGKIWSAGKLAKRLPGLLSDADKERYAALFCREDHQFWPGRKEGGCQSVWGRMEAGTVERGHGSGRTAGSEVRNHWADLALAAARDESQLRADAAGHGQGHGSKSAGRGLGIGSQAGDGTDEIRDVSRSHSDYRAYLQQFAVWQECVETDPDSFDYIYYTLGMTQYDGMPLIEPLEYREGHRLEKLVIAIDTSGSVKNDTVRRFLEEMYAILDEKENFFSRMEVWIIQCDCVIEDVAKIASRADWDAYLRELKIIGRSGTDFRPVFRYIADAQRRGEMKDLKGLLYFTDGDGVYPREEPPYQTAFVFVEETPGMSLVPKWARVLRAWHLGSEYLR